MTKYASDSDGHIKNHLSQGVNQEVVISTVGPSKIANPIGPNTQLVRLVSTSACHYAIDENANAAITDAFLPADTIEYISAAPGDTVSIIEATGGSGGIITVTEMA